MAAKAAKREAAIAAPLVVENFDRLIHERTRLAIVSALAVNDRLTFNEMKEILQTSDGNVSVSGTNTAVKGDAIAGGTVSLGGGATVTGTTTDNAPAITFPPVPVCGPPYSSSTGISGIFYTYDPSTGVLTTDSKNAATVTLAGTPVRSCDTTAASAMEEMNCSCGVSPSTGRLRRGISMPAASPPRPSTSSSRRPASPAGSARSSRFPRSLAWRGR